MVSAVSVFEKDAIPLLANEARSGAGGADARLIAERVLESPPFRKERERTGPRHQSKFNAAESDLHPKRPHAPARSQAAAGMSIEPQRLSDLQPFLPYLTSDLHFPS